MRNKLKKIKTFAKLLSKGKHIIKVEHISTYACNLKCKFCGLHRQKTKELNTKEVKALMKKFSEKGVISWYFGGGEPLFRKDMKELVAYGKKLGFHITMTTNGILVPKHINWLHKVDLLGISLEGPKVIHDSICGKRTYEKVIKALNLLKKNKINFYIACVMSKKLLDNNMQGLKKMLGLAKKLKTRTSFLPVYLDKFNKQETGRLIPSEKDFQKAIQLLLHFKKKNSKLLMMSKAVLKQYEKGIKPFECKAGDLFCTVFPDGSIKPCRFKQKNPNKCKCNVLCYLEYNNLFSKSWNSIGDIINNIKYV